MTDRLDRLESRLVHLEKKTRVLVSALTIALVVLAAGAFGGWAQAQRPPSDQTLRARGLIIEDAQGQPRIMLGSPIGDRNERGNPRTGMIINDASGVERFAVSLLNSERVIMGFDAPRGKGDDRNRERITIVADENGGSHIRFVDRRTRVPARLYLDDENRVWLEFNDVQSSNIVRRRIGFSGEQSFKESQ